MPGTAPTASGVQYPSNPHTCADLMGATHVAGQQVSPTMQRRNYLQKRKLLLPPVNWRWVKEGDGYVRHEGLAPYPYRD